MSFYGLPETGLAEARFELENALFQHEQWSEELNRTLIVRLPPDARDLDLDAHAKCRFGQWLMTSGAERLSMHPDFPEILAAHQRMHDCARALLTSISRGEPADMNQHERFLASLKLMRSLLGGIKHELEDAIHNIDPLTGAANRVGMIKRLTEEQALVERKGRQSWLVMADLDLFKQVNDDHGHAAGDRVLVGFAKCVTSRVRPYDMLFRYGGEEFLLCLVDMPEDAARDLVERLRQDFAKICFESDLDGAFHATASFGLAPLTADMTPEQAIERADQALYAAKRGGRNYVAVWDPSMAAIEVDRPLAAAMAAPPH